MIVKSLEMFLELEGGIELSQKGVAGSAELGLGDNCALFTKTVPEREESEADQRPYPQL